MYRYTETGELFRESDGACIPCDPGNRDYRKALAWIEAGGEVKPYQANISPLEGLAAAEHDEWLIQQAVRRIKSANATQPPAEVEDADDGIPDAFRGLMLDGESAEKFTERMRRRWQALKHLQIDGTKPTPARALPDMTPEESEELADLERRNSQHKWLD